MIKLHDWGMTRKKQEITEPLKRDQLSFRVADHRGRRKRHTSAIAVVGMIVAC